MYQKKIYTIVKLVTFVSNVLTKEEKNLTKETNVTKIVH